MRSRNRLSAAFVKRASAGKWCDGAGLWLVKRPDGGAQWVLHETVLTFDDFRAADEVFLSGNMMKVTPVTQFDDTHYQVGPVTRRARELYWDWALSG